jgi:putative transposase
MKKYSAIEKFRILDLNINDGVPLARVAVECQVSLRTLHQWKRDFKSGGLNKLGLKERQDKGSSRVLSEELENISKAYALQKPALTIKAIFRKICGHAADRKMMVPSYSTVYNCIKGINAGLMTLAHFGAKAYQQKHELIFRTECQDPNQIWQVDHSLLDINLIDDKGNVRKPWLTAVIDDYSRAVCGYFLSFESPCSVNTALCLRQAIWKKNNPSWPMCGIPQILYTDHGTDFMSLHIEQVCIRLKIRMINSMVGRPQGRGKIERFFQTVNEYMLADLPGYLHHGKPTSNPKLTITQLDEITQRFIVNEYHQHIHSKTDETPIQRWVSNGFLPQLPDSTIELDLLLMTVDKTRRVQRDGVRFQGFRYISTVLAGFVGETVTVRYDPRDLAEIRIYFDEKFLCIGICQDIAETIISLKDIQKARREIKGELYDEIRKAKRLIKYIQKDRTDPSKDVGVKIQKEANTKKLKLYQND